MGPCYVANVNINKKKGNVCDALDCVSSVSLQISRSEIKVL